MKVHLVDGTYELFRHYFGRQVRGGSGASPTAATAGVLSSVLSLVADGATHLAVATDHVIESFRNELWAGYKTGAGVARELLDQFEPLELALEAMGIAVFAMVELEADDALAALARTAAADPAVTQVLICTPDKDLAQCVVGRRVVQLDRRADRILDEDGVWAKFGVAPQSIPDWLALVGDSADGFPGLPGWGKRSAATVLAHYGHLEAVPAEASAWDPAVRAAVRSAPILAATLADAWEAAVLFRDLATLRADSALVSEVEELRWEGPTEGFHDVCARLGEPRLAERAAALGRQARSAPEAGP